MAEQDLPRDVDIRALMKDWRAEFYSTSLKAKSRFEPIVEITSSSENSKIAELTEGIARFQSVPLVKRFLRNKPHFYICKDDPFDPDHMGTRVRYPKMVLISDKDFYKHSPEELTAIAAHEIGHSLRLDKHPKNPRIKKTRTEEEWLEGELFADKVAAFLTYGSDGLLTGLKKLKDDYEANYSENLIDNPEPAALRVIKARINKAEETIKRLSSEQGRIEVESELVQELEAQRRNLFPHHFNRPIDSLSR